MIQTAMGRLLLFVCVILITIGTNPEAAIASEPTDEKAYA